MNIKAVSIALFLSSTAALAMPDQVVIIRHGEKPDKGDELSTQGCERAYLLPAFFQKNSEVQQYGNPVAYYASAPDKSGGSLRPVETITPTVIAAGLKVNDTYVRLQQTAAAKEVSGYSGGTVVMSWEHDAIPGLAQAFNLTLVTGETDKWPDAVFDEAWILRFPSSGTTVDIIPEEVMPGDNLLGGLTDWQTPPTPATTLQITIPPDIVDKCDTNQGIDALEALAEQNTTPPLPPATADQKGH